MTNGLKRLCVLALLAAGCLPMAAARAEDGPVQTIRVSMLAPNALLWSHAVANAKGFYAKRSIRILELRTASSPALLEAVSSGSAEAGVSLGDLAIRAIDQGAPIIIAGAIMDRVTLRLVGGVGITSLSQLNGQPVSAGAVEGGTANLLRFQLQRAGVNPRGVQMISITASSDRLIAMANGRVKGALMTAPFDAMAVQKGMKILDVYREPYLLTPLILNTAWAAKNPDAARKLMQALREAAEWIYRPENKQEAIQILASYTKTPPDICVDAYDFLIGKQHALSRTMQVSAISLENIIAVDHAVGANPASTRNFELARYYDPRFLAAN
jgi:ABC-type nitrate/sulfonate/bicarbonate transport system substrate-binding protein